MSIVVFCGPTIDADAIRQVLPAALCRGPASRGDVYLACRHQPSAIAIIDGYFDHRLSVWHKEILWALSTGVRVYGAGSMGALRAAELAAYGMVGVGFIYEAFARGELEDDDEVAVLHAPDESGYTPQSDALVNIRATLRLALSEGIINSEDQARLIAAAKARYYAERSLLAILSEWGIHAPAQATRLREWVLARGIVDQKRADAVRLLQLLVQHEKEPATAPRGERFRLANTHYWHLLRRTLDGAGAPPDELARAEAAERALALALATLAGAEVSAAEAQQASEHFRREHALLTPEATSHWMRANGLDLEGFSKLAQERVLVRRFAGAAQAALRRQLPSVLRDRARPEPEQPAAAMRKR